MEFNGTFLVTIITFILFVFLMNKILYAPILKIMEERKLFIEDNYKLADKNLEKAKVLENEREEKLADAKSSAKDKYNEVLNEYKEKNSVIISNAQAEAKNELETAGIELDRVSDEVKNNLKSSMTGLASDIVEKVIGYRTEINSFDEECVNNILWEK